MNWKYVKPKKIFHPFIICVFLGVALGVEGFAFAQRSINADVIFVIDTSGSMANEVQLLESVFNVFTHAFEQSGVNLHIIVLASDQFCLPGPTGSGLCPDDENLPLYRHVQIEIGSTDGLTKILSTYDQWKDMLRSDSNRTLVIFSDDDSEMSSQEFNANLLSLDAGFQGYKFHGFVNTTCGILGTEYISLANLTEGSLHDLCHGINVEIGLKEIANIIQMDLNNPAPPPPPSASCSDSIDLAIETGKTYMKTSRSVKTICKKESFDCTDALIQASEVFTELSDANRNMINSCN